MTGCVFAGLLSVANADSKSHPHQDDSQNTENVPPLVSQQVAAENTEDVPPLVVPFIECAFVCMCVCVYARMGVRAYVRVGAFLNAQMVDKFIVFSLCRRFRRIYSYPSDKLRC